MVQPSIFALPKLEENTPIPSSFIKYALISMVILVSYGLIGSHYIMGLDFINSIYFTVTTMTTVGFGDIVPITPVQKIFVVTLVLVVLDY